MLPDGYDLDNDVTKLGAAAQGLPRLTLFGGFNSRHSRHASFTSLRSDSGTPDSFMRVLPPGTFVDLNRTVYVPSSSFEITCRVRTFSVKMST